MDDTTRRLLRQVRRLLALGIDVVGPLILVPVGIFAAVSATAQLPSPGAAPPLSENARIFLFVVLPCALLLAWWATLALLLARAGSSPGKSLTRLRVIAADGQPVGFVRGVLVRAGVPIVASIVAIHLWWPAWPLLALLDGLALPLTSRTLHDWIAGTDVVDA